MTHRNDQIGSNVVAVTPSDTTAVKYVALYVGTGGNVAVQHRQGTTVTYSNVPSGAVLCTADFVRVMSTNTTASNILGVEP